MRLIRAWKPPQWEVIGAIRDRGPLRVSFWSDQEFVSRSISKRAYIHHEVLRGLEVQPAWDWRGDQVLSDESIRLDGLRNPLKVDLYVPPSRLLAQLPPRFDLILPLSELSERFSTTPDTLWVDQAGWLRSGSTQLPTPSLTPSLTPSSSKTSPAWDRFEHWRFSNAYPHEVIGARVDHEGEVIIKWRRPQRPLPPHLWILANVASPKAPPQLVNMWAHSTSRGVDESASLNFAVSKLTPFKALHHAPRGATQRCTYASPCPVVILDVTYRDQVCHHDVCTDTVASPDLDVDD